MIKCLEFNLYIFIYNKNYHFNNEVFKEVSRLW